jgi:hypothetical protein
MSFVSYFFGLHPNPDAPEDHPHYRYGTDSPAPQIQWGSTDKDNQKEYNLLIVVSNYPPQVEDFLLRVWMSKGKWYYDYSLMYELLHRDDFAPWEDDGKTKEEVWGGNRRKQGLTSDLGPCDTEEDAKSEGYAFAGQALHAILHNPEAW